MAAVVAQQQSEIKKITEKILGSLSSPEAVFLVMCTPPMNKL
jgi:hypothetical protein